MTVFNSVRLISLCTKTFSLLFFIFGIIAIEPNYLAFSFKGKNVSCNSIQEPTVMAYNQCAACKVFKSFLKCPHCIHIKIISRFIKKKNVCSVLKRSEEHTSELQSLRHLVC